ncbi:hypothetical protein pb186bvf_010440 [Paramecium bursaria]
MIVELDDQLQMIQLFLQRKVDFYEVYEVTRYLAFEGRESDMLDIIQSHYRTYAYKLESLQRVQEDTIYFDMIQENWASYKLQLKQNIEVLKYLDVKCPLEPFIENIITTILSSDIQNRMYTVLLKEIKQWRQQKDSQQIPHIQILDLIKKLPTFSNFISDILVQTEEFYTQYEHDTDLVQAVQYANNTYQLEHKIFTQFPNNIWKKVFDILNNLIFKFIRIQDIGEIFLQFNHMREVYNFCKSIDQVLLFKQGLRKCIKQQICTIMQMHESEMIHALISLEKQVDSLIDKLFEQQDKITILQNALEDGFQENQEKFCYAMSKLISIQNHTYDIVKYIKILPDKAKFEHYYTKVLIQRLMYTNFDVNQEYHLLKVLENVCTDEWIMNCQQMIESIPNNNQNVVKFNEKIEQQQRKTKNQKRIEFHIFKIPQVIWPYDYENVTVPDELNKLFYTVLQDLLLKVNLSNPFELEVDLRLGLELLQFNKAQFVKLDNPQIFGDLVIKTDNGYRVNLNYKSTKPLETRFVEYVYKEEKQSKQFYQDTDQQIRTFLSKTLYLQLRKDYPKFIQLAEKESIHESINQLNQKEFIRVKLPNVEYIP